MTREAAAKSHGPATQTVSIIDLTPDGTVLTQNAIGKQTTYRGLSTPGPIPQVGEMWLMDRVHGDWQFSVRIRATPPVVTGSRALADPVSLSLLEAMVTIGFVVDGTSP